MKVIQKVNNKKKTNKHKKYSGIGLNEKTKTNQLKKNTTWREKPKEIIENICTRYRDRFKKYKQNKTFQKNEKKSTDYYEENARGHTINRMRLNLNYSEVKSGKTKDITKRPSREIKF